MLAVMLALIAAVSFSGSDYAAGRAAREAGQPEAGEPGGTDEPDEADLAPVVRVTVAAELITTLAVLGRRPTCGRWPPQRWHRC